MVDVQQLQPPQRQRNVNNRIHANAEALMQLANNNAIHIMGGHFQLRQTKLLDIILRLPPLFMMDQVYIFFKCFDSLFIFRPFSDFAL
jgi:hypothetical protein